MTNSPFIVELKRSIPEAQWRWVISALIKDPIIWNNLQNALGQRLISRGNIKEADLCPASLALLELGYPITVEDLRTIPLEPFEAGERALVSPRGTMLAPSIDGGQLSQDNGQNNLAQAGLQALELRERRRLAGSWQNISPQLLLSMSPTALVCLYGMIPDPLDLLRAILAPSLNTNSTQDDPKKACTLAVHIFLANPQPPEVQIDILHNLLEGLPWVQRLCMLDTLANQWPGLAANLIGDNNDLHTSSKGYFSPSYPANIVLPHLEQMAYLFQASELYRITAKPGQHIQALSRTIQVAHRFEALLAAQLAQIAAQNGDYESAISSWEKANQLDPETPEYRTCLALALLDAGRDSEAQALIDSPQPDIKHAQARPAEPLWLIARARMAVKKGELESARQGARRACGRLQEIMSDKINELNRPKGSRDNSITWFPHTQLYCDQLYRFARSMYELEMFQEVVGLSEAFLQTNPNQPKWISLLGFGQQALGRCSDAVQAAHLAVALAPQNPDLRKNLVKILEAAGEWADALGERIVTLEHTGEASEEALLELAACGIRAGQPEHALEICHQAMQSSAFIAPEGVAAPRQAGQEGSQAIAYTLLGEAYGALSRQQESLDYLLRATQLSPALASPWLALARHHRQNEGMGRAIETLRAAAQASPESFEIHLALGEAYLSENAPTQALPYLRKAADLIMDTGPISFGEHGNWHTDNENGDLPYSFNFPGHLTRHDLAMTTRLRLGQTLKQLGHLSEARCYLEDVYHAHPTDAEIAASFAQTLLELNEYDTALAPLEKVLEANPEDLSHHLDFAKCLVILANRAESDYVLDLLPSKKNKPASDLRAERAIPALQQVLKVHPGHLEARTMLAEALAATGALDDAMKAYRQVIDAHPNLDVEWQVRLSLGLGQTAMKLGQPDTAIAAFQEAALINPDNPRVQRHLSEAYSALGFKIDAFQSALSARALAPDDLDMLLWFARQAIDLHNQPGTQLPQSKVEAINSLKHACELAPKRTDLQVWLGQTQADIGDGGAARNTFLKLANRVLDDCDPDTLTRDLHRAAHSLLSLGDIPGAAICLQKALTIYQSLPREESDHEGADGLSQLELLTDLIQVRLMDGDPDSALVLLDQAIAIAPERAGLYLEKAEIYLALNPKQVEAAQACLVHALSLIGDDLDQRLRAAHIAREVGELPTALEQVGEILRSYRQAVSGEGSQTKLDYSSHRNVMVARILAADLARSMLMPEEARAILDDALWSGASLEPTQDTAPCSQDALITWILTYGTQIVNEHLDIPPCDPLQVEYCALHAMLALENDEVAIAEKDLLGIQDQASNNPRLLAIQSMLASRRGEIGKANQILHRALKGLEDVIQSNAYASAPEGRESEGITQARAESNPREKLEARSNILNAQLSIAQAAGALNNWGIAMPALEAAVQSAPCDPSVQLNYAISLVRRAEFQRLCQRIMVIRHAPGEAAMSDEARQSFRVAIEKSEELLRRFGYEQIPEARAILKRWSARGEAVFQPGQAAAQELQAIPATPEDIAAMVACLAEIGDLDGAISASQPHSQYPLVLVELALALEDQRPRQAMAAAQSAVEQISRRENLSPADNKSQPLLRQIYAEQAVYTPIFDALLAQLVHKYGNRIEDNNIAGHSIAQALMEWPDEPRWHALAAEISLKSEGQEDPPLAAEAIRHLETAIQLEPGFIAHQINLGRIYLKEGSPHQAIQVLDQATRMTPSSPEVWLCLSEAFRSIGDLDQAAICADHAISLKSDQAYPLLLRGEIALQANNPRGAQSRAQAALRINPKDPTALTLLVRALTALDRSTQALEVIEAALPHSENPLTLLTERVRILQRTQGIEVSLQNLQDLVDKYPNEPAVLTLLAETMESTGHTEEAIRLAQRALSAKKGWGNGQMASDDAKLHHLIGRQLRRSGQLDQAIHHLSEAIRLAPHQVEIYLDLGQTHQDRRQYVQALKVYKNAIVVAPEDYRPYYHAGLALKESKDYLSAERMLRKASKLAPNEVSIHRLLGAVVALNLVHNRGEISHEMHSTSSLDG